MIKLYYSYGEHRGEDFIRASLLRAFGNNNFIIKRTENGKPYVEDEGVFFSLSHTQGLTICVVSDENIGADVEKIRPVRQKERISLKFMGKDSSFLTDKEFLKMWTAFESLIKYFG